MTLQDRKAPIFRSLFPSPLSSVIRYALRRQLDVAERLIQTLSLSIYSESFRAAHTEALQGHIERGRQVLDEEVAAEQGRLEHNIRAEAWKESANAVRVGIFAELLRLAPRGVNAQRWVDSFFINRSRNTFTDDDEPPEPELDEPPQES